MHIAHLRAAIEVSEALEAQIGRVDFVPVKHQPLKNNSTILPFAWRMEMIQAVIGNMPDFAVNDVEDSRSGPSYTYDTLARYPGASCRDERYFLMGSDDFRQLEKWHRGLELPDVANLVVVPRKGFGIGKMMEIVRKFWPDDENFPRTLSIRLKNHDITVIMLHNGGKIYYLNIPYLDISSTAIREAWLNGRNIAWLVPEAVRDFLERNRQAATGVWRGK